MLRFQRMIKKYFLLYELDQALNNIKRKERILNFKNDKIIELEN